jgi:hypothetical protein
MNPNQQFAESAGMAQPFPVLRRIVSFSALSNLAELWHSMGKGGNALSIWVAVGAPSLQPVSLTGAAGPRWRPQNHPQIATRPVSGPATDR